MKRPNLTGRVTPDEHKAAAAPENGHAPSLAHVLLDIPAELSTLRRVSAWPRIGKTR